MSQKKDEMISFKLRLKGELHTQLKNVAAERGNSLNSEIIERLLRSIEAGDRLGSDMDARMFETMAHDIAVVELKTGKKWREDFYTNGAARHMAIKHIKRVWPVHKNQKHMDEVWQEAMRLETIVNGQLEYFKDYRVITPVPEADNTPILGSAVAALTSGYPPLERPMFDIDNEEQANINRRLQMKDYRLAVSLTEDVKSWDLGKEVAFEDRVGIRAALSSFASYTEQFDTKILEWSNLGADELKESAKGEAMAKTWSAA